MANNATLVLRDDRDSEETLPIALRSDLPVSTLDTGGAGRLLHKAYLASGRSVEKTLGRAAHKLGSGPTATSCRIKKAFGDDALTRQSTLDRIYDSFRDGTTTAQHECLLRALKKDCQKLLNYALPSRSPTTQVDTFRNIIVLTTRYPGLRRIFLQSPDITRVADSLDAICELWRSPGYRYDRQSRFTLEFAAHCLAGHSGNPIDLEDIRPSELGRTCKESLGVVDRLLVRYCDGGSGFSRLIAIRYLAGILELPAFWAEGYESQKLTMDKLCKQALLLIEDINPDSLRVDDIDRLSLLDPDGIDALAEAVLAGGERWIQGGLAIKVLGSHSWLPSFVKLVKVLRGLILPELLPLASQRANGNWDAFFKDITDQRPMSSLDCQYEDVYIRVDEQVGRMPPRVIWAPPDIAEGPSSLLGTFTARFQSAFFGRTAPWAEEVIPSNSLSGEEPSGGNYLRPETSQDTVDGILEEETDDESTHNRPSSLLEHINAATRTTILGPTASNVQERVPSLPPSPVLSADTMDPIEDDSTRHTAAYQPSQSSATISTSSASIGAGTHQSASPILPTMYPYALPYPQYPYPYIPNTGVPPAEAPWSQSREGTSGVGYPHGGYQPFQPSGVPAGGAYFITPSPSVSQKGDDAEEPVRLSPVLMHYVPAALRPNGVADVVSHAPVNMMVSPPSTPQKPLAAALHNSYHSPHHSTYDHSVSYSGDPIEDNDIRRTPINGSHQSHSSARTRSWVSSNQMNPPPPPIEPAPLGGYTPFHGLRPHPEPDAHSASLEMPLKSGSNQSSILGRSRARDAPYAPLGTAPSPRSWVYPYNQHHPTPPPPSPTDRPSPLSSPFHKKDRLHASLPSSAQFSPVPPPQIPKQDRSFVGGFLQGLKRIPRVSRGDRDTIPANKAPSARSWVYPYNQHQPTSPTIGGHTDVTGLAGNTLPRYLSNPSIGPTNPQFAHRLSQAVANGSLPPEITPAAFQLRPPQQPVVSVSPPSDGAEEEQQAEYFEGPPPHELPQVVNPLPSPTDRPSPLTGPFHRQKEQRAIPMGEDDGLDNTDNMQTNSLGIDFGDAPSRRSSARNTPYTPPNLGARPWVYPYNQHQPTPLPPSPADNFPFHRRNELHATSMGYEDDSDDPDTNESLEIDFGHHWTEPPSSKNKDKKSVIGRVIRSVGTVFGKEASSNDRKLKRNASYYTVPRSATYGESTTNSVAGPLGPLGLGPGTLNHNVPVPILEVPETGSGSPESLPIDIVRLSDDIPPLQTRSLGRGNI